MDFQFSAIDAELILMLKLKKIILRNKGQGVVEYAMLLAFMVILLVGLMLDNTGTVKIEVSKSFNRTASVFNN